MSDIYSAVKPLMYVSAALGLGPFSIDDESKAVLTRKTSVLYSLAVFGLFAGISAYVAYIRLEKAIASFTYIGDYTYLVLLICGIVVAMCCLLLVIVQRKKIVRMIENFHSVHCQMSRLNVRVPCDRLKRISVLVLSLLALLLVSLFAHDYIITQDPLGAFFWVAYFAPVVCTTMMQCQFVLGGLLLRWNFARLNEKLTNFATDEAEMVADQKKFIDGGYFESNLIRRSSDQATNAWESDFSKFRIRKIAPQNDLVGHPISSLAKVKVIRKIHSNLCEIKELLNSSYSLQLLTTVAQAFVIITTNLYTLFTSGSKVTTHPGVVAREVSMGISFPIIWAVIRSFELVCITVTCTKISKTANYTAVIVHKLLSRDWDSTVRNQLKLFSIQLLHRKISFSACGFFTLDMTLLHGIIGAATTYLVILIQFHNTYEQTS